MKLEVAGKDYSRFVRASAINRIDAIASTFAFTATSEDGVPLPFKGGESCVVSVDGEPIITGFIEIVSVDGSSEEHSIEITGRSRTGDLLDSSFGALSDLSASVTMKRVLEKVIEHIDPSTSSRERIQVIDNANPDPFNPAEDKLAPEQGQSVFEFFEKLSRKRQVLFTDDADGNLVIQTGVGTVVDAKIQNLIRDNGNGVIRYSVSYDTTGRFNVYRVFSQPNAGGLFSATPDVVAGGGDEQTDADIRRGRQLVLISETASSSGESFNRAIWEANVRRARGRVYGATVHGYRNQSGDIWRPNTVVQVVDDFAGINSQMLVNTVEFSMTPNDGRVTVLSLVERNAYQLTLEEPVEEEELGDDLFG